LSPSEDPCVIKLSDLPGGARSFELVARFCYGVKLELTAVNSVLLRCAAQHLDMSEELCEGNLISHTEAFLNKNVLRSWKDSLKALQSCEEILPYSEKLGIVKRCIDSLAVKACTDPNLFSWPMEYGGAMQSPGGSVLWNGISTGARPRNFSPDWWYDDVANLSFSMYKRLIQAMELRGIRQEIIGGSLTHYAKKYLPGLTRRQTAGPVGLTAQLSEEEQKNLLEEIDGLLPVKKGLIPTKVLFGMLRTALILKADAPCVCKLEKRIGLQLDQASLEDLLLPSFTYTMETLYNVECVQRMLEHFLQMDQLENNGMASPGLMDDVTGSPSLTPLTNVARLIDGYLAEIAPDINLKPPKFQTLAGMVPDYARPLDDGLYRAIDIYLKVCCSISIQVITVMLLSIMKFLPLPVLCIL
jgi:NPH3 family